MDVPPTANKASSPDICISSGDDALAGRSSHPVWTRSGQHGLDTQPRPVSARGRPERHARADHFEMRGMRRRARHGEAEPADYRVPLWHEIIGDVTGQSSDVGRGEAPLTSRAAAGALAGDECRSRASPPRCMPPNRTPRLMPWSRLTGKNGFSSATSISCPRPAMPSAFRGGEAFPMKLRKAPHETGSPRMSACGRSVRRGPASPPRVE